MQNQGIKFAFARLFLLRRWWMRTCHVTPVLCADEDRGAPQELYAPWWAWPLELAHRAQYGCTFINSEHVDALPPKKAEVVDRAMADALRTARQSNGPCGCYFPKKHEQQQPRET